MEHTIIDILALVLSIISLIYTYLSNSTSSKNSKINLTVSEYNKFQNDILSKVDKYRNQKELNIIIKNYRTSRRDDYRELTELVYKIENFAFCVNNEIYDEDLITELSKNTFLYLYRDLKPFINKKRAFTNCKENYKDFEKLANKYK